MSDKEMQIFDGLIAEYELRAKYNDDPRDYETYSVLVKARGIIAEHKDKSDVFKELLRNSGKYIVYMDKYCNYEGHVITNDNFKKLLQEVEDCKGC